MCSGEFFFFLDRAVHPFFIKRKIVNSTNRVRSRKRGASMTQAHQAT
jgi:hypothetical protein